MPAIDQAIAALTAFEPTGIEDDDVGRLDEMLDTVVAREHIQAIAPAILGVFERFPNALLGSPGPLVHCIERLPIATFLPLVLDSFRKKTTRTNDVLDDRLLSARNASRSAPAKRARGIARGPSTAR